MKKILLAVFIFLALCSPCIGADKQVTFLWNQTISSDFAGWHLYSSLTPYVQPVETNLILTIPYGGTQQTEYTSDQVFQCPDNTATTHYFIMTAFDVDANESGPSNEVSYTFDCMAPSVPVQFRVRLKQ
jgi:hypothetical protein